MIVYHGSIEAVEKPDVGHSYQQNKRMNEHNGISVTEIVQIYKHTFLKSFSRFGRNSVYYVWNYHNYMGKDRQDRYAKEGY